MGKDAKKQQHAAFRRFTASLDASGVVQPMDESCGGSVFGEEGTGSGPGRQYPKALLAFPGGLADASGTWQDLALLTALRRCLGPGLGNHLALGSEASCAAAMLGGIVEWQGTDNVEGEHTAMRGGGGRGKSSLAGRKATKKRGQERLHRQSAKDTFFGMGL